MDDLEMFNSIIEQLTPFPVVNKFANKTLSKVCVPLQYLLAKGDRIGWVLFAEYRTARICALLPSLLDGCCSVSLLDSALLPLNSTYSRAKFTPPTSKHSWSCLASTCHWYLPSFSSSFSGTRFSTNRYDR